ncbi:MAG TPA: hypothetical protein VFQ39_10595 [Longimicrobium sp.]|nr:hypothetical protein [Longimicrobium sp.]
MKKIRLDLDALDVDSFDTSSPRRARGTMVGHEFSAQTDCQQQTCANTCHVTWCQNTCAGTCDPTQWGEGCGGGQTANCPLHTETCTQGERCYSIPGGWCYPTDYATCELC